MPYKIARRYDAVFGINADYFNKKSNGKGVIIREGVVYADSKKNSTLAIMPDGSLKAFEPGAIDADQLKQMGVKDSFSFGPILVQDGAVDSASMKRHWLPRNAHEYRTGIGQVEPGHYIVIVTNGYFTMPQFAQLFIDNHCTMAYNMDGGHSACMLFMGEQLNRLNISGIIKNLRQRPLPDLLLLGENAAVPDVTAAVYCDGVNRYAKNRPQPTEGVIK
jgi:exopolysaccharide biosynthesis protein